MAEYIERDVLLSIFNAKADMAVGTPKEVFFSVVKMVNLLPAAKITPCDVCAYNPPSSGDGKPCTICPAMAKGV